MPLFVTEVEAGSTVMIGDAPLRIQDMVAVARGARVELSVAAVDRIGRSREIIEEKLRAEEPTYGLNRSLGHNKDRRIPNDELTQFSLRMLRSHEGGLGPPLPPDIVRAAMLARVVGISRGGSGASPAMPETLVAMLNSGITPVVPSMGSVGAADLGQMAAIGLVAIGEGWADYRCERMSGAETLRAVGIKPLVLGPKDGLTVLSEIGISVGHGALVASQAFRAAELADAVAALSLEAIGGNVSAIDAAVGDARPFRGQIDSAAHMRVLLEGSYLQSHAFESVQEALSFRVIPQVHGTVREMLTFAVGAVETELNSAADNPLVTADGRVVHNGNFEPLVMAVAFDALRVALAHAGQLSERRMGHLWEAIFNRPEALASGRRFYGIKLRYPAAARFAELRQLAAPATLDVPSLDIGVEDHATGAPLSVSQTDAAVSKLEDILIIELLLACDLLSGREEAVRLGEGTSRLLAAVEGVLAGPETNVPAADVHAAIRERLIG